jgi:hypothetical protein
MSLDGIIMPIILPCCYARESQGGIILRPNGGVGIIDYYSMAAGGVPKEGALRDLGGDGQYLTCNNHCHILLVTLKHRNLK